jgi:hypothetical protein
LTLSMSITTYVVVWVHRFGPPDADVTVLVVVCRLPFVRFWSWFIIVNGFVPISLYVSIELVQYMQGKFMGNR